MNNDKPRPAHPLRMMAADYDQASRPVSDRFNPLPSHIPHVGHQNRGEHQSHRGKGKGNFHKPTAQSGRIEDFLLPEMYQDPWVELYGRLEESVRARETVHLSEAELQIVERNVIDRQPPKRAQVPF